MRNYTIEKKIGILKLLKEADESRWLIFEINPIIRYKNWYEVEIAMKEVFYEILEDLKIEREDFCTIINNNMKPGTPYTTINKWIGKQTSCGFYTKITEEIIKTLEWLIKMRIAAEAREEK